MWLYLVHSIAVKVHYIKAGAKLHAVGHPWCPSRPGKIIKLSPNMGADVLLEEVPNHVSSLCPARFAPAR